VWATAGGGGGLKSLPPNSLGLVESSSGRLLLQAAVRLPGVPVSVTGSGKMMWVALGEPHEIVEIDPARGKLVHTVKLAAVPRRIAPAPDGVWVAESYEGTIALVDAATRRVGLPVRLFPPTRVSFAEQRDRLWTAGGQPGGAAELDPGTGRVLARRRGLDNPIAAAVGFGSLWLASSTRAEVQRLRGRSVKSFQIGSSPLDVATGAGAVWAVTPSDGTLWRIDPRHQDVAASVAVGKDPEFVVVGDGGVWVASRLPGVLTRVDPSSNKVVSTLRLGRPVGALALVGRRLWVGVM
jgi:streptogramin lyase